MASLPCPLPTRATGVATTSARAGGRAAFLSHRPSPPARGQLPAASLLGTPALPTPAASGPRAVAWRPPSRWSGGGGAVRTTRQEGGSKDATLPPPPAAAAGGEGGQPEDKKKQKKKKKRRASGYAGPSPRQFLRKAAIRGKASAWRAAQAAARWPGVRHALAAAARAYGRTAPARASLSAAWDALRIDYGAFLAAETRRTWAWAAEHRVERGVAAEHVTWLRSFCLTTLWAALAPPTILATLGIPFALQSLRYGLAGQAASPVLWAVLLVCQGLGKWPVGMPLMPWV